MSATEYESDWRLRHAITESLAESPYLYCHPADRGRIGRAIVDALAAAGYGIHHLDRRGDGRPGRGRKDDDQ